MTSSADAKPAGDDGKTGAKGAGSAGGAPADAVPPAPDAMPPALRSMWRLLKLGYSNEPGLLVAALTLTLLAALPDALLAVWLKLLGEGVLAGDRGRVVTAAF